MYPTAVREDLVEDLHGLRVADPYRWLEDPASPATTAWTAAQEQLFRQHIDVLPATARFTGRLSELERAGLVGPPAPYGKRLFLMRREPDRDHMVLHVVEPDDSRRVLIDPVELDPSGRTLIDVWQVSPDGDRVVFLTSTGGDEESVLRVLDVDTGEILDGPIDRCRNSTIAFTPDGSAFYYVRRLPPHAVPAGEEKYHRRVWLHRVGTSADDDVLIFGDGLDKATHLRVQSGHGRLTVSASRGAQPGNDLWLADLNTTPWDDPLWLVVQDGVAARTALRTAADGMAYLMTDRDAPRGRVVIAEAANPSVWRDLVAEDPEAVLADIALLETDGADPVLVVAWRRHAASELTLHDGRTGALRGTVPLPGVGTVSGLAARGTELFLGYTDWTTPVSVLRYDAATGTTGTWSAAPAGQSPPGVLSTPVDYRSADGTEVRMIVLGRAGVTGPRPTLLTVYGGFGVPMAPGYHPQALAWVEAGGTFAVAQVRGGGEKGAAWHRAGTGAGKQRAVDDLHAAAEALIAGGRTTAAQLVISGGSNGGLVVAAAAVQRPELYRAVVCASPLLDMVRYEHSGLAAAWRAEYGSASEPAELAWLLELSPYHRVREKVPYPAVLFSVAAADARVDPLHVRKMAAALQWATREIDPIARPVLIRTDSETGHAARSVSSSVTMNAEILAFSATAAGLFG